MLPHRTLWSLCWHSIVSHITFSLQNTFVSLHLRACYPANSRKTVVSTRLWLSWRYSNWLLKLFMWILEYFFDLNISSFVNDPTKKKLFGLHHCLRGLRAVHWMVLWGTRGPRSTGWEWLIRYSALFCNCCCQFLLTQFALPFVITKLSTLQHQRPSFHLALSCLICMELL